MIGFSIKQCVGIAAAIASVAFTAAAAKAQTITGGELQGRQAKKVMTTLASFADSCVPRPHAMLLAEKRPANLTNKELVGRIKQVAKRSIPGASQSLDSELFADGSFAGLDPAHFDSSNFSPERRARCRAQAGSLSKRYDVFGVVGRNRSGLNVFGYVFQARLGAHSHLFFLVSQPYQDLLGGLLRTSDDFGEVLTIFELISRRQIFHGTDAALLHLLDNPSAGRLSDLRLAQLDLARRAVIAGGGAHAERLAAGRYLEDEQTKWRLFTARNPDTDRPIDVVLFDEIDDGRYSVGFEPGTTRIRYVYYEN